MIDAKPIGYILYIGDNPKPLGVVKSLDIRITNDKVHFPNFFALFTKEITMRGHIKKSEVCKVFGIRYMKLRKWYRRRNKWMFRDSPKR